MYILDRVEGNTAVIEYSDGKTIRMINVSKDKVAASEGDVLTFDGSLYTADKQQTDYRRKQIISKMKREFF